MYNKYTSVELYMHDSTWLAIVITKRKNSSALLGTGFRKPAGVLRCEIPPKDRVAIFAAIAAFTSLPADLFLRQEKVPMLHIAAVVRSSGSSVYARQLFAPFLARMH